MPMFREDVTGPGGSPESRPEELPAGDSAPIQIQTSPGVDRWLGRRLSEESIRTELCEGPVPDTPPRPVTPRDAVSRAVSDRAELIERLKRGESPTWVPSRHLEGLLQHGKQSSPPRTPRTPRLADSPSPGLLPAPLITPEKQDTSLSQRPPSPLTSGLDIERPRSALHSGNFTPVETTPPASGTARDASLLSGPGHHDQFRPAHTPWMSTSPPPSSALFDFSRGTPSYRKEVFGSGPSSLSSSLSSNFIYKPPTSPLVQSESNEDLDLTLPMNSFNIDTNSPRSSRRHTLNFGHSPFANATAHTRQPSLRRESTFPYQAHQPRRLSNSGFPLPGSSPQTPFFRSRRPSVGVEASPLQHASMVGSYEESILRGRMSTTPSRPLEFTAQIGVLGLGKCKASLRCPSHVTLPFSAVFYNYAATTPGGVKVDDGPSPYVGQIDLENGLPNSEEGQRARRKMQARYQDLMNASGADGQDPAAAETSDVKAPPGGNYRIPEKGQLQIIIKNQNKTAVKLFLVPYDLAGMEPGTKTFIRQRSYSTGPIIDPELPAVAATTTATADRPTLRYLIHLHICCPSKGRYYLYKSIRVVFANRVPDGKERLRNEITYPDPRFTPYKPVRVMHPPAQPPQQTPTHPTSLSMSNPFYSPTTPGNDTMTPSPGTMDIRRRSAGFVLGPASSSSSEVMLGLEMTGSPSPTATTFRPLRYGTAAGHDPLNNINKNRNNPENRHEEGAPRTTSSSDSSGSSSTTAATEGLLSQGLRSLEVEQDRWLRQQQEQEQPQQTAPSANNNKTGRHHGSTAATSQHEQY
ncbi:hypothetical protein VTJ49DRAFT_5874 [Mycothermus thermophilus]|uniref:Atos-like conserved domain-containing protein n=1 Tax=Humicola insolens TaxID=85995 RepID=A0ABR3VK22_HUMIN